MQITKRKLFKSTVAKVMAVTMAVTMLPVPANANTEDNTVAEDNGNTTEGSENTEEAAVTTLPPATKEGVITLTENVVLTENKTFDTATTINLNEYNITVEGEHFITAKNSLTINGTSGTILKKLSDGTKPNTKAFISVEGTDGKIVINGGKIQNDFGFGILAQNGGSIYMNGGEVSSKYCALSGNNLLGDMNVYVAGGTLTTETGACIYMPSNLNLYIGKKAVQESNAGTEAVINSDTAEPILTGGVSVRMGNIKISGGEFNAMTEKEDGDKIDSPAVEYNNQNVWFPDAFWVMGGTYNSSSGEGSPNTNALKLNIEGGTFNCNNGKGSAIAIYDFGKEKQTMDINVTGGTFNKIGDVTTYGDGVKDDASRATRTAFDILTLDNIFGSDKSYDTTNYNKTDVIKYNKANRTISIAGGTFNKTNEKFTNSDEIKIKDGSCLKKGEDKDTSVTVAIHNSETETVAFKPANLSEEVTDNSGNIEYSRCTNCGEASIKTNDGNFTKINEEDAKLYWLALRAESDNTTVSFDESTVKGTESYGMYRDVPFIVSPADKGYRINGVPEVTFSVEDTATANDATGLATFKPGEMTEDGISYKGTIATGAAFATTQGTKDCRVYVKANIEAIPYNVTSKSLEIENADVVITKNGNPFALDGDTDAKVNVEDRIVIKIIPKTGYVITVDEEKRESNVIIKDIAVNAGFKELIGGTYTIEYWQITKDICINLDAFSTETVEYDVYLPERHVTAAKNQHVTASLDNTGVSALTPETVLRLVPDKGYEIVSATVTTAENTCVISDMEDDKTDSRTKLIKLSNITGDTAINSLEVVTKKSEYKLSYDTSGLLNATAVSQVGKLEDIILNFDSTDTLTITPEKGYKLTNGINVVPATEGACTVEPQPSSNGSQVFKISGLSSDCKVIVSGEATPIEYTVSLDRTKLAETDATVTLKKDGNNFTTGGTANINSRLEVIITPKAGRAFKDIPVAEIDKNTDGIANAAIGTAIASDGSYTYTVYNFTGNTKITVSGTTEATSHNIIMPSAEKLSETLKNATALLDFTKVADNGIANITITPNNGCQIKSDIKITLKDSASCNPPLVKAGANGTFIITLSGIKADTEITSITAEAETAKIIEAGTDVATNIGGANLSGTFDLTGKTDEDKTAIEEKQNNIIEEVKKTIGSATTSSVISSNGKPVTEELVKEFQQVVQSHDDNTIITLSLEVKGKEATELDTSENEEIVNKQTNIKDKHIAAAGNTVTISEPYPLDIKLFASVTGNNVDDRVKGLKAAITNAGDTIKITMAVPSYIPKKELNVVKRVYHVLRLHKGVKEAREAEGSIQTEILDCGYDEATDTISFESDKFSTYVLQYTDETKKPEATETPTQTPDSSQTPSMPNYIPSGIGGGITTPSPSASPSATPGTEPTKEPGASFAPSITPGTEPTVKPGTEPTKAPGTQPTKTPGTEPTKAPGTEPTKKPSAVQTGKKVTVNGVKCTVTSTGKVKTVKATGSKNAKSVVIPANVKISGKAYKVTAIANNAFKGSTKLTKVTIGSNIKKIGKNAFKGCKNLKKITIKTKKLTKGTVGKNAFKGINKKAVVKVPKGKAKTYKKIIKARGAKNSIKVK